jgi:hypothetical protein
MTVGMAATMMVKNGRVEEAIEQQKKAAAALEALGAQSVRTILLTMSTPVRIVMSFEAEDQAALGVITDKWQIDPVSQEITARNLGEDGTISGYVAETYIEV